MSQKISKLGLKQMLFICIASIICIATLALGLGLGFGTSKNDTPAEALQNENRVLPNGMAQISAGGGHTMAIDASGNLWAWGNNEFGQLGNMSTGQINSTAFNITAQYGNPLYGKQIVQVSAGFGNTMVIDVSGNLWAFGWNMYGQLSDMTTDDSSTAINITAQPGNPLYGIQIVQVSVGGGHAVAIDASGNLWAWGYNIYGQLGNMSSGVDVNETPINITAQYGNPLYGKQIVQVSTKFLSTMVIDSTGDLWAFGDNGRGQLGNMSNTARSTPINITAQPGNTLYGQHIVQVSAGYIHTMAIDSTGSLWTWGYNYYGQLGNGSTNDSNYPMNITDQAYNPLYEKQIVQVSAGGEYSMAIDSAGNLWAFGNNSYGQLGDMSTISSSIPMNITDQGAELPNGIQIVQVSTGYQHTVAIDSQGNLWVCGYNRDGQLGKMTTSGESANSSPMNITDQPGNPLYQSKFGRMQVSAGTNHTMLIDASGNLWAFGINDRGQLGNMTSNGNSGNSTPFNITAQPDNPLENKKIVQLATGGGFTMAIDSTGNLWAFGYNYYGQLGNMSTGTINSTPFNITAQPGNPLYGKQIIQVSVDNSHTMAIDSQGNLWTFGYNGNGQLGDLSTANSSTPLNITDQESNPLYGKQIVQVTTGNSHSLAIDSQGDLWAFGYNYYGQLGNMTNNSVPNRTPINITAQAGNPLYGKQIVQVSAGQYHSVAIDSTGSLWTFGRSNYGQLGNMLTIDSSTPINITEQWGNPLYDKQIVQVSTGTGEYTMAIDSTGYLWAFGNGASGRLGNMSTTAINSTPINITAQPDNSLDGRQIIQVSAGRDHTIAIDSTGIIWAFGLNSTGQLGNVSYNNSSTPVSIFIPPIHVGTSATISGSPEARISVRTNFTTGWGELTASGGTYTDWTPSILRAPGVLKNASTQTGRVRYEFDANGINTINTMTINGISITLTSYSTLTYWNDILYLRIIQTDNNRRLIVEMYRISQQVTIAVTTTNNARVAAIMLGTPSARISVRTNFTTGWGELTASGGTHTDWIVNSPLASPDIKRNDSTEAGRVRYEFDTNGINTISTMTINEISINLTGYSSLDQWDNLLCLRILSADSGRRLIVEMDRINTDQPVAIVVTTTNIARATATISGSPNARISVRTDFTTGWGTEATSGGTFINWTADALTSPDVNRNDSTQAGRIRYEFDAVGINTVSALTINGIQIDLASYSNLTLWENILYLRVISADSGRRLIVEMDRISAHQLITLAVTTTRNVQHSFNFSTNSHISSRMSVDFGAETKSLINTYSPTWTGNIGTINLAVLTFTSQSSFAKITISRPNLPDITITIFTGFLATLAPTSGLVGSISNTTGATNTITITLTSMEQYEYTWTIETYEQIQVQQILNPPAGAASVANPALLTLNSSSGEGWASAAFASPGNLFGKTFAGWYSHPTGGTLIINTAQLQQHVTATGGATVFLYAHWA